MRYSGWVAKKLKGTSAESYINDARKLLGQLEKRMELGGQDVLWKTREVEDGVVIRVGFIFGKPYIEIVTQGVPGTSTAYEYYMDSGFINLEESAEILEQNAASRGLYNNYSYNLFETLEPKSEVDGSIPPSFGSESKRVSTLKSFPNNFSGKLKQLVSGKLGLKLNDPYYNNIGSFARNLAGKPRLSGECIYTDGDGFYWFIQIGEDSFSGTATKIITPLQGLVEEARSLWGWNNDKTIQIETHALAVAEISTTTMPLEFTGPVIEGLPLGYGWHFDSDGTRAVLVTNSPVPGKDYTHQSHKYTLTLSKRANDFFINIIDTGEGGEWKLSSQAPVWQLKEYFNGEEAILIHCPVSMPPSGPGEATNAIIYAWYKEDDSIVDVKYTGYEDTGHEENSACYDPPTYGQGLVVDGVSLAPLDWKKWDDRVYDSFKADDVVEEAETGFWTGRTVTSLTTSENKTTTFIPGICCGTPGEVSLTVYDYYCDAVHWSNHVEHTGVYNPCPSPGNTNFCVIDRNQTDISLTWSITYEQDDGGGPIYESRSSVAFVVPLDCVDGGIIINGKNVRNFARVHEGSRSSGIVWKREVTAWVRNCDHTPDHDCPTTSGTASGVVLPANYIGGPMTKINAQNELYLTRVFFTNNDNFKKEEPVVIEEGLENWNLTSPWDMWLVKLSQPNCLGPNAKVTYGILTDDVWASANFSLDPDIDGLFPEDAETTIGWC